MIKKKTLSLDCFNSLKKKTKAWIEKELPIAESFQKREREREQNRTQKRLHNENGVMGSESEKCNVERGERESWC